MILHARDARRGRLVVAANAIARQLGVLPKMPLNQACALCPDAQIVEHDPQADIEALCSIAEAAQCFSPIVGIETLDAEPWAGRSIHQPQAVLLDVTGIAHIFGDEQKLTQAVMAWIQSQKYYASIAIAPSVGAAWALANYARRSHIAAQMLTLATHGSFAAIQPAVSIAPSETSAEQIESLPIESLRIDQVTASKLHRLGVRTINQLMDLPRAGLVSRLGETLLDRIDQTLNSKHEPIVGLHATPELSIFECLEHPTPVRESIDEILLSQMRNLVHTLHQMGHGAVRLVCRIELERNAIPVDLDTETTIPPTRLTKVFQIGLYQPSADPAHLLWLLSGQLDSVFQQAPRNANEEGCWVRSIGLQATQTAPIIWQQTNLFERQIVLHRDAIARLIDNLSARMGRTAVVAPKIHRDPQPELAFSWRPLTGWRKDGLPQETKRKIAKQPRRDFFTEQNIGPSSNDYWRRPIRLHSAPVPIEVRKLSQAGVIEELCIRGKVQPVVECCGPERVDSGWWQGATQQRDYYRVELESSSWIWIYLDRRSQCWYLHGEFD